MNTTAEVTESSRGRSWVWPVSIVVGLLVVVVVNVAFAWVAVGGQDEVLDSYVEEDRWGEQR